MKLTHERATWALLFGALLLTSSCSKDEDTQVTPDPTPTPSNTVTIDNAINTDATWTADKKYLLKGFVEIESGHTLTIEPGTVILGDKDTKGTLIVNRGAKLIAAGTASSPIVFTSAQPAGSRAPGDWGGIILCGKAPINLPGGTGVVEGGVEAVFGGTDAADNSGVLQYVRIEFPGIAFQPNNEINGLTLAGVGNGTTIDHIQVSYSGDDSYEWFGGTVNVKNLVAYIGLDDDFDMDNGYSGHVQFGVALRDPDIADASGSNGLEDDNDASGSDADPHTTPVMSNISVFGPKRDATTAINSNFKRGNHLRRNTRTRLFNSVFAGFPTGVLIDGATTTANCDAGLLKVRNCVYAGMTDAVYAETTGSWDVATWFTNGGNTSYTQNSDLGVRDPFNESAPEFTLNGTSPLNSGSDFSDGDLSDPFFTNVTYRGAFGTENWTSGWCNWNPQNTTY